MQLYRLPTAFMSILFALVFIAACADSTMPERTADARASLHRGSMEPSTDYLMPGITVTVPQGCDPWLDLHWCQGSTGCGQLMTDPAGHAEQFLADCPGGNLGGGGLGGSAGGNGSSPPVSTVGNQGPAAFAACVGTLLILMGSTAIMQPAADNLYEARSEYDSAKRMYDVVMENPHTLEMELLYAHRVEVAKVGYDGAILGYAGAAGTAVGAVIAAVVACSPGMILPTP